MTLTDLVSFFFQARDGARGPGDLGLRGPERSVDSELSSPGLGSKGGAPPLSHSRMSYRQVIIYYKVF